MSDELRAGTAFYEREAVRIISLGGFMELLEYSHDILIMHNDLALLHLVGQRLVPSIWLQIFSRCRVTGQIVIYLADHNSFLEFLRLQEHGLGNS